MNKMKKLFTTIFLSVVIVGISSIAVVKVVNAQAGGGSTTILPKGADVSQEECKKKLIDLDKEAYPVKKFKEKNTSERETVLACAIKTGRIHFWMVPYFIVYIIEFLIGISALIAILFIVIGGYQLVISGADDTQKDSAKNTIKHAIMGVTLTLIAWTVVNLIQYVVTI